LQRHAPVTLRQWRSGRDARSAGSGSRQRRRRVRGRRRVGLGVGSRGGASKRGCAEGAIPRATARPSVRARRCTGWEGRRRRTSPDVTRRLRRGSPWSYGEKSAKSWTPRRAGHAPASTAVCAKSAENSPTRGRQRAHVTRRLRRTSHRDDEEIAPDLGACHGPAWRAGWVGCSDGRRDSKPDRAADDEPGRAR